MVDTSSVILLVSTNILVVAILRSFVYEIYVYRNHDGSPIILNPFSIDLIDNMSFNAHTALTYREFCSMVPQ